MTDPVNNIPSTTPAIDALVTSLEGMGEDDSSAKDIALMIRFAVDALKAIDVPEPHAKSARIASTALGVMETIAMGRPDGPA